MALLHTCTVAPQHAGVLQVLALAALAGAAVSMFTGTTYFRRLVRREDEPLAFWANVACLALLGGLCGAGLLLCGRG